MSKKRVPTSQYVIIANGKRRPYVFNVYSAIMNHCNPDETAVLVKGGDELIGNQVFILLNSIYRFTKAPIIYANHLYGSIQDKTIIKGNSTSYLLEKRQSEFISKKMNFSPLRSFNVSLFLKINSEDLK